MWFWKNRRGAVNLGMAFGVAVSASLHAARGEIVDLEPEAILPIEADIAVEPSGLCLRDEVLFSVSDDTDDTIFRIERDGAVARFLPAVRFEPPPGTPAGPLDLEGIVAGPEGSFYLLSEGHARVLQVNPGGSSRWLTPSVEAAGKMAGLFTAPGGGCEGLAVLEHGRFLLLAERQPRGWLEVGSEGLERAGKLIRSNFSSHLALTRVPDATGADWHHGTLYMLFRNGDLVTTLEPTTEGWVEGRKGWSFAKILHDPRWRYQQRVFGNAEGLAVDAEHFYVIIDNNGDGHDRDPTDTRPTLLILKRA